ncbi:hypothetical protein DFH06DRAFT_1347540 [Mycena polygramma]|nr:hypothetical protein DFH06DRAFT_1347540 [Mycena polygramma]
MPVIPQELLEAIVEELDDVPSLKACSLAGSPLIHSSQRNLHSLLILRQGSCSAARCTFLEETPRIASYITRLTINLPEANHNNDFENFLRVLSVLTRVRTCILGGSGFAWYSHLSRPLSVAIVKFLAHQPLHQLHAQSLYDLPTPEEPAFVPPPLPRSFNIQLIRFTKSDSIVKLLAYPKPAFHIAALRELHLTLPYVWVEFHGYALITSAAPTLEYITISVKGPSVYSSRFLAIDHVRIINSSDWTRTGDSALHIPEFQGPLPVLRRLELKFNLADLDLLWLSQTVPAFLSVSPALATLVISIRPPVASLESNMLSDDDLTKISALQNDLLAHPASPSIIWQFEKSSRYDGMFDRFAPHVLEGMGEMHATGRLGCQRYREPFHISWSDIRCLS